MSKARIPDKTITLRTPWENYRSDMLARAESILAFPRRRWALIGAFAFLLFGLMYTGAMNLHQTNTQGIAYLLLAKHYAAGNFELAVSSYWSPLLSWLLAIGFKLGWSEPVAARMAMGFSGALFWSASVGLLFVCGLSVRSLLIAAWLTAAVTLFWSIEHLSPDLLGAGLLLAALTLSLVAVRSTSWRATLGVGMSWAAVYYASALLLPAVVVSLIGFALLERLTSESNRVGCRRILAQMFVAWLAMLPWWGLLSWHYDRPTIGSVWAIDHAVAGPDEVDRYHPCFGRFNVPAEGRLANWEDPGRLDYAYWSPFADAEHRAHQRGLIWNNVRSIVKVWSGFGWLGVGIAALAACFVVRFSRGLKPLTETWRRAALPAGGIALGVLFLSVEPYDTRFFYGCFPLMLLAAFGLLEGLPATWPRDLLTWLVAVLFALPAITKCAAALDGIPNYGGYAALDLERRLRERNLSGPVAGDGMLLGNRTGLYLACLLDTPWHGGISDVPGEDYLATGAHLVVVTSGDRANADLQINPNYINLTDQLFATRQEAEQFPLRLYRLRQ